MCSPQLLRWFWAVPPLYTPGKLLTDHSQQSQELWGWPQGRASAHKSSEEIPSVPGTKAGTVPPPTAPSAL